MGSILSLAELVRRSQRRGDRAVLEHEDFGVGPSESDGVVPPRRLARVTAWQPFAVKPDPQDPDRDLNARWYYALREVDIDDTFAVSDLAQQDFVVLPTDPATDVVAIFMGELTNVDQRSGTQGDSVNQLPGVYPQQMDLSPLGAGVDGVPANSVVVEYELRHTASGRKYYLILGVVSAHNGGCD